jgi:predicted PurR-regulated permease PerM
LRDEATQAAQAVPQLVERARQVITPGNDPANPPPHGSSGSVPVPAGLLGAIQTVAGSVFTFAGNVTVVFFLCFFLLTGHHFKGRILEIIGPDVDRRRQFTTIINDVNAQIQRFLVVRLITATVVGALTWLALVWMGVANAGVWGLLAGTFNSIPYFGPIVVSGGLFLVGLVQDGGMAQALQMAGVALLITTLEGWLLTPLLLGKAENMNALTVFVGLLVWTWIWGAWGTILAVPMLVIAKAVADHTPSLKPFGRLMAP